MGKKVTLLGGGAWGTAVATLLAHNGYKVCLWCFEQEIVDAIRTFRINKKYLPGIELHENIQPTASLHEALDHSKIIFEAIPVIFLRLVLEQAKPYITLEHSWITLSKGIENKTLLFPNQIIEEMLGSVRHLAVLGGPNFADQVAERKGSATVVASKDDKFSKLIGNMVGSSYFKPYLSSDVIGVSIGGALKNVLSLFTGIIQGAGYLENTQAFLFTRCFAEIVAIVKLYNGLPQTVYGLSGLGDMILSGTNKGGRNCQIGQMIGNGNRLSDCELKMKVLPEGINTIKSLYSIITENDISAPLCIATYKIVFEEKSVRSFVDEILHAPLEYEYL